jgi:hypothetical protein
MVAMAARGEDQGPGMAHLVEGDVAAGTDRTARGRARGNRPQQGTAPCGARRDPVGAPRGRRTPPRLCGKRGRSEHGLHPGPLRRTLLSQPAAITRAREPRAASPTAQRGRQGPRSRDATSGHPRAASPRLLRLHHLRLSALEDPPTLIPNLACHRLHPPSVRHHDGGPP